MARKKSTTQRANANSTRIAQNKHKTLQDEIVNPIVEFSNKYPYPVKISANKQAKVYFDEIILELQNPVVYQPIDRYAVGDLTIWMIALDNCDITEPTIVEENCNNKQLQVKENPNIKAAATAQRKINELRKELGLTPSARLDFMLKASTINQQDIQTNKTLESNNKGLDFDGMAGKHKYKGPKK